MWGLLIVALTFVIEGVSVFVLMNLFSRGEYETQAREAEGVRGEVPGTAPVEARKAA